MRIITREELMKEPAGVWYAEYEPQVFGEICVKHDTCYQSMEDKDYVYGDPRRPDPRIDLRRPNDWFCSELMELGCSDERDEKLDSGGSFDLDHECIGRDGCFDHQQLYVLFELKDLATIQLSLDKAIGVEEGKDG